MVEVNGLDNQYDSSIGELTSEPMPKFSIGIQFSMPLGSKKTFTEKQMILMKQLQYDADSANKRSMMQSQAEKTLKLIELLERALDAQRRSLSINEKKLEFSKRRFSQAREPLAIVIDDEIGLLNTKINAIQIQSQVVDAVLEYLRIFDKMQCKFS
jgi:outer membrane protein TolC